MAAPKGNDYASRGRRWAQAIEVAVEHWPEEPPYVDCSGLVKGLRKAAHAFVSKMMEERDEKFFKEFGDRLDGKSHQSVGVGAGDSPVTIVVRTGVPDPEH